MKLLHVEQVVAGWQQPVTPPVSLVLNRGEIIGLSGPNGGGKSTLLAALAGQGRVFSGLVSVSQGVRICFQTQTLPPLDGLPLSGRELLALTGASPEGLPSWLTGCLTQRLDRLSGGQRQYLSLWAVLQAPGEILLLDEPSNHLDAAGAKHLKVALKRRAAQGAGVLLVSHDQDLMHACCDRIVVLEGNRG